MKPVFRCGYKTPTIIKIIISLICIFSFPYLFIIMIKSVTSTSSIALDKTIILIIYPIALIIELAIISSFRTPNIFLFYSNFMLYKEKLTLKDRITLFFAKDDLAKLENILTKRNYVNISKLEIIVNQHQYVRTNESYLSIIFKLVFNDNKTFTPSVYEETKEAYQQFLKPFINYHVNIHDPYHFIEGLNQPLRLSDYFNINP